MTLGRRKFVAVAAAAVGVAGLAAGAVAATNGPSEGADDLASAINARAGTSLSAADITGAFQDLLKERLDEAVAAGKLTRAQADQMLQRAKEAPGLPPFRGFGHGGPRHAGPAGDLLAPVAKKLDLTEAQLRTKLRSGSTLAKIAKEEGVSRAELIATIRSRLTAKGVPTDRAADIAAHIADETGPGRGHRGFGPGGWRP